MGNFSLPEESLPEDLVREESLPEDLVREEGVEPSRVAPHASETCAYAIPPLPQKLMSA